MRPSRISRLGDEKLHYYGISYGTWLGFWYAGLFPERAGPMVLDSNMNFSRSIHEASIASKQGQALTFNEFIAPYAARHDDLQGLGANATLVKANLQSVGRQVKKALIPSMPPNGQSRICSRAISPP